MQEQETKKTANRPGRPPAGKSLTPQAVAEAAAELIDAEGIGDFSMRRLGQNLGDRRSAAHLGGGPGQGAQVR